MAVRRYGMLFILGMQQAGIIKEFTLDQDIMSEFSHSSKEGRGSEEQESAVKEDMLPEEEESRTNSPDWLGPEIPTKKIQHPEMTTEQHHKTRNRDWRHRRK